MFHWNEILFWYTRKCAPNPCYPEFWMDVNCTQLSDTGTLWFVIRTGRISMNESCVYIYIYVYIHDPFIDILPVRITNHKVPYVYIHIYVRISMKESCLASNSHEKMFSLIALFFHSEYTRWPALLFLSLASELVNILAELLF